MGNLDMFRWIYGFFGIQEEFFKDLFWFFWELMDDFGHDIDIICLDFWELDELLVVGCWSGSWHSSPSKKFIINICYHKLSNSPNSMVSPIHTKPCVNPI